MAGKTVESNGHLTVKQEGAIVALLNEQSVARAATAARVGERTLYRWLREPAFSRAYRQARRDAFGQAIALTQRYAPLAVNTLPARSKPRLPAISEFLGTFELSMLIMGLQG